MKINRKKLLKLYLAKVNEIADLDEEKSIFSPEECVNIIADILEGKKQASLLDLYEQYKGTQSEYAKIKALASKKKIKLAAQLIIDQYAKPYPYIQLGILKRGKFKDFYYGSGLEYNEFQKFIPEGFSEAMESTYEYHPGRSLSEEKYIKESFDILSQCGYTRIEDFIE